MAPLTLLNQGIRFLLELCLLVVGCCWGAGIGGSLPARVLLGAGVLVLFAVVWGRFLAPRSSRRLAGLRLHLLEFALFSVAAWMLHDLGANGAAVTFAAAYMLNKALLAVLTR